MIHKCLKVKGNSSREFNFYKIEASKMKRKNNYIFQIFVFI